MAAANYPGPGKAREFLRGVIKMVPELTADPEFEDLRESPYIFQRAAVHYPSPGKTREFLRKEMKDRPKPGKHAGRVEQHSNPDTEELTR